MKRNDFIVHRSRRVKNGEILYIGKVSCEKDNNIYGQLIEISNIENKEYGYSRSLFNLYDFGRKDELRTLYSNELFWIRLNIMGECLKTIHH